MASIIPGGAWVPCNTFYKDDESVDYEACKAHAERMVRGGNNLVIQGSNGEAINLNREERIQVIKQVRAHLASKGLKAHIMAGTGAPTLIETLQLTQDAKDAGADSCIVISPSYWAPQIKPNLIDFYQKLADKSPLPIVIYNFPGVSNGIDLDSDTLIKLAQHPNIVGCKLTCANIGKTHRVASNTDKSNFVVMAGKSDVFLHSLVAGATGAVCGPCNIAPKVHSEMYKRYQAGDLKGAKEVQDLLSDIDPIVSGLGLGGMKLFTSQNFGYGTGVARTPLANGVPDKVKVAVAPLAKLMETESKL